jgi:hypothetical protein
LRIIGWEVEMGNARYFMAMILMCGCVASAEAQPVESRNVEIGAGVGGVATWFGGGRGIPGGDLRITVPTTHRRAVEGFIGLTPAVNHATTGFYGLLLKQSVGKQTRPEVENFFSYGVLGGFVHYREGEYRRPSDGSTVQSRSRTIITPPFIGLIGGGVQRRVAPRLAVRLESQVIMALILPVGVRVATSVSVPLGRLDAR